MKIFLVLAKRMQFDSQLFGLLGLVILNSAIQRNGSTSRSISTNQTAGRLGLGTLKLAYQRTESISRSVSTNQIVGQLSLSNSVGWKQTQPLILSKWLLLGSKGCLGWAEVEYKS